MPLFLSDTKCAHTLMHTYGRIQTHTRMHNTYACTAEILLGSLQVRDLFFPPDP
uniref:Uncharacterized protein n=1 Tax=Anguilla anguilla TaxID=7936 RepID=A0A0E9WGX5_ANGAN